MIVLHTSHGAITLELDAENAPKTVENFVQYVRDGHYDNTVFHRVIDGFMIQGGGMEPGMKQKPTRAPIANEAGNGLKNKRYTVAMARTNEPHSATLMKNWAVAEWGSLVRAIATVYLRFLRPLPASFATGARVGFCFMPGAKPPPWIMKPSITRWNTVSS